MIRRALEILALVALLLLFAAGVAAITNAVLDARVLSQEQLSQ